MTKAQQAEKQEAIAQLREWLSPGDTVYTILRHCSRSGMQRTVGVVILKDGDPLHPNYSVARAIGARQDSKRDGVVVGGAGMDMGFHIVYNLGHALWPSGYGCSGPGCRSNDHANGDRDYTPHDDGTPRDSSEVGTDIPAKRSHRHWHRDGGYALNHRWL